MLSVEETRPDDIISQLPEPRELPAGDLLDVRSSTLLIAAAGFEERAVCICSATSISLIDDVLLVLYPMNEEDNSSALRVFRDAVSEASLHEVRYMRSTFRREMEKVMKLGLSEIPKFITIDISSMASFVFYIIFDLVCELYGDVQLTIFYAEAQTYFPSLEEWQRFQSSVNDRGDIIEMAEMYEQANFQSRGVSQVIESKEHPGSNSAALPVSCIAVPNFSLERMKTMLTYVDSQYSCRSEQLIWIIGDPPNEVRNGWRRDALKELYNRPENCRLVSTIDYKHLLRTLDETWSNSVLNAHLLIATLGSKMQHLATAMFLRMHCEVGLVLSEPEEFVARRYSEGVGQRWVVDFGNIKALRTLLEGRGSLRCNWE